MMTIKIVEGEIAAILPHISGWCSNEKAARMARLTSGARLCVELGVFGGRGLVAMALMLRAQGAGSAHGIDPYTADAALEGTNHKANDEWWSSVDLEHVLRGARLTLKRERLDAYAQIIRERSQDVVERYADGSIDVLHQDSNHSEEVSCAEVMLWGPKIRVGGYWIFDDTDWPTTKKAQDLLLESGFVELDDHSKWKVYRKVE